MCIHNFKRDFKLQNFCLAPLLKCYQVIVALLIACCVFAIIKLRIWSFVQFIKANIKRGKNAKNCYVNCIAKKKWIVTIFAICIAAKLAKE